MSWIQVFAFDASSQSNEDLEQEREHVLMGVLSDGDGEDEADDMIGLQMEYFIHEVLLRNQVRVDEPFCLWWSVFLKAM